MRHFAARELEAAIAYAAAGGQALHTHRIIGDWRKAPRCFKVVFTRGEHLAHLFDQDEVRLVATVKRLGVRVVLVERLGTPRQHVGLVGVPLRRALALCEPAPAIEEA